MLVEDGGDLVFLQGHDAGVAGMLQVDIGCTDGRVFVIFFSM